VVVDLERERDRKSFEREREEGVTKIEKASRSRPHCAGFSV
jgi:hypothetical protein